MSDHKNADATAVAHPPAKAGGSMLGKLVVALFMGAVIVTEMIAFYCLFPDADKVASLAEEKIAKKLATKVVDGDEDEGKGKGDKKLIEVDVGRFDISVHHAAANMTIRVSFELFGTVRDDDKLEFQSLKDASLNRLRDKIIFEIRNAESSDITDPGLGLIKRRILEKSNSVLGKPLLKSVMFSNFTYAEQ
jgi:hypothetical protein